MHRIEVEGELSTALKSKPTNAGYTVRQLKKQKELFQIKRNAQKVRKILISQIEGMPVTP